MKIILWTFLALAVLLAPGIAVAVEPAPASPHKFSSNVSLVSDYVYRGISRSGQKGAIQGGFDYTHAGGLYAGVWGSSISWISDWNLAINAGLELDTYAGYRNRYDEDIFYDAGFVRYNYPTGYYVTPRPVNFSKADTNEVYGLIGYKWVTLKYSYSLGDTFAVAVAQGSNYIDLSATYPIPETTITLGAHAGKQTYKGAAAKYLAAAGSDPSYADIRLSATMDIDGYLLGIAYSNTNTSKANWAFYKAMNNDLGRATVVLSIKRAM